MDSISKYINVDELREMVRLYAHQLLIGYEDTREEPSWVVSEKMAEIYEYLLPFASLDQTKIMETKFPEDYWLLYQKRNFLNAE